MTDRFTQQHVDAWRHDGGVPIPNFFTPEECAAVCADFDAVFGRSEGGGAAADFKKVGEIGRFNKHQTDDNVTIPLACSPVLNLIGVHPAMVAFARAALGTDDILLYQHEVWAKFTGDADYDQPFHTDYGNHTLTAPSTDARLNSITTLAYFTEVTEAHGPAHYVSRPDATRVTSPEVWLSRDPEVQRQTQAALAPLSRSSAGPAGTIFPYTVDIWHRGTNLTAPGGRRYAVMASYHRRDVPAVNRYAWPLYASQPWNIIFDNATVEQLTMFGVQPPGDPFWTEETLRRTQFRYPNWDSSPYRAAMRIAA